MSGLIKVNWIPIPISVFAVNGLQYVVLVEVCEENLALYRHVAGKIEYLIVFLYNCGYSFWYCTKM